MASNDSVSSENGGNSNLEEQFRTFARFGDSKSSGEAITCSNIDKWMKQAKVIDGKKITTTDTGIYFKQIAKAKRNITFKEFTQFVENLAKNKKADSAEILKKLATCGHPGITGTTAVLKSSAVDRLTDHSKYTGTHKQRFEAESGKGKGKEGREDMVDDSGYVAAFKDAGTYDEKHAAN